MAGQYYLIPQINRNSKNWTVRVTLTEDIVPMKTSKLDLKRYVFTDEEGNQIIAAGYGADIPKLMSQLRLFRVYDITNAYVSEVKPEYRILNNRFQWNLEKRTLITEISQAKPNLRYFLDNIIPLSLISNYLDDRNKTVDIMGIIIKVDEVKNVLCERGELPVQTFTFLDSEKRTMKVSIWEHMTVNQSPALITAAHNHSVVVAKRLVIKRFEGGTLNAKNSSSFAIDPPIEAATQLKEWFESVQEIELSKWLADANDIIKISRKNVDRGIMKTHTVNEVVKAFESGDYWVRGYLQIAEENQKLLYNACSNCTRSINIEEGRQYICRYCDKEVLAIPKAMVIMSVRDHTGIINVAAITTVAESILQTTATEIARLARLAISSK